MRSRRKRQPFTPCKTFPDRNYPGVKTIHLSCGGNEYHPVCADGGQPNRLATPSLTRTRCTSSVARADRVEADRHCLEETITFSPAPTFGAARTLLGQEYVHKR